MNTAIIDSVQQEDSGEGDARVRATPAIGSLSGNGVLSGVEVAYGRDEFVGFWSRLERWPSLYKRSVFSVPAVSLHVLHPFRSRRCKTHVPVRVGWQNLKGFLDPCAIRS